MIVPLADRPQVVTAGLLAVAPLPAGVAVLGGPTVEILGGGLTAALLTVAIACWLLEARPGGEPA